MLGSTPALAFHGSPKSYDDWIFSTTPDEELRPLLIDTEATVLLGGHTHLQMMRRYEDSLIVNPGSVGLPFREWWPRPVLISPWAEYGVVGGDNGQLSIDLRRTPFDVDAFLADEPRVGDAARRVVGQLLGAGLAQRREIVVTVPSGAMRRMWPVGPACEDVCDTVGRDLDVVRIEERWDRESRAATPLGLRRTTRCSLPSIT